MHHEIEGAAFRSNVPPVSQAGPWNDDASRWPGMTMPLFGTEYRYVSPKSYAACQPMANHSVPVRRSVRHRNIPVTNTLSAPIGPSPGLRKCTAPNASESSSAAGQKAHSRGEGELQIAAKEKLLVEAHQQKHRGPNQRVAHQTGARKTIAPKEYPPSARISKIRALMPPIPQSAPCQKFSAKCPRQRHSIVAEGAALEAGSISGRGDRAERRQALLRKASRA